MNLLILIILIILPSYILGKYIYKKDPEKKDKKVLRKIIGISIIFTIVAAIFEWIAKVLLPNNHSFIGYIIECMIGVALIEEVCKFLPAYWIGIKNKEINNKYDFIIYAAFSAIGFATFENIIYVFTSSGINTAIYRMIFSVPAHIVYGILMGYFLGIAQQEKQNKNQKQYHINMIYSLLIPTIFHGIYDFGIVYGVTASNALILITPYIVVITLFLYAISKLKKVASNKEDEADKNKDNGRKLLFIGCVLILALLILSSINPVRLNNGHYNMKENVKIKEEGISIIVESFEEDEITNQVTLNLKIQNYSNQMIALKANQFSFVNMNNTKDVRELNRFENNSQNLLYIQPKETSITKIKFRNVVLAENNNYLLAYTTKDDSAKSYIIFVGEDFAQALQNRK